MTPVTLILNRAEAGDPKAIEELLPLVYEELRRLAAYKMSQIPPGQTLQPTALVHEAYLRLVNIPGHEWKGRDHFFRTAAEAMRRILIDNARRKACEKHGGGRTKVDLDSVDLAVNATPDNLLLVNDALEQLQQHDPVKAELIKLRFFVGMTLEEAAAILGFTERTAKRYWVHARAWLLLRIEESLADKSR